VKAHQILVAADVTDAAQDQQQVQPMLAPTPQNGGAAGVTEKVQEAVADAGFSREAQVA
jgi:hypothetical protein